MYRLITFGSDGVWWQDYSSAQELFNAQDEIIESLLYDGFETFLRPLMHKGVGINYRWIEIHAVIARSGVAI